MRFKLVVVPLLLDKDSVSFLWSMLAKGELNGPWKRASFSVSPVGVVSQLCSKDEEDTWLYDSVWAQLSEKVILLLDYIWILSHWVDLSLYWLIELWSHELFNSACNKHTIRGNLFSSLFINEQIASLTSRSE